MKTMGRLILIGLLLFGLTACNQQTGATETAEANTDAQTEAVSTSETEVTESAAEPVTEPVTEEPSATEPQSAPKALPMKAADFFYAEDNWHVNYFEEGASERSTVAAPEYTQDQRLQIAVCGDLADCEIQIWETGEDYVAKTAATGDAWFRQNLLIMPEDEFTNTLPEPIIFLQEPIEVGHSWTSGPFNMVIVDVTPPTQEHGARVVVENATEGSDSTDLYTFEEGRWMIRHEDGAASETAVTTIAEYESGARRYPVNLFYPGTMDASGNHYLQVEAQALFPVNASNREILAQLYREYLPEGAMPVLKTGDTINSLYLNRDGNVYVDVSRSFSDMNAGSTGEVMILHAMAYTAADLVQGTEGVILTLDNALYEGGHVALEQGETLPALPGEQDSVTKVE